MPDRSSMGGNEPKGPRKNPGTGRNLAAVALGRLGGKKGGPARARKLSPEERTAIARKAARARWRKTGKTK